MKDVQEGEPDSSMFPCHKPVTFVGRDVKAKKTITFRYYNGNFASKILVDGFMDRLDQEFESSTCPPVPGTNKSLDTCLSCMSHLYRSALQGKCNEMCPMAQNVSVQKDNTPWFNNNVIRIAIKLRKYKETKWQRMKTHDSGPEYVTTRNAVPIIDRNSLRLARLGHEEALCLPNDLLRNTKKKTVS